MTLYLYGEGEKEDDDDEEENLGVGGFAIDDECILGDDAVGCWNNNGPACPILLNWVDNSYAAAAAAAVVVVVDDDDEGILLLLLALFESMISIGMSRVNSLAITWFQYAFLLWIAIVTTDEDDENLLFEAMCEMLTGSSMFAKP